MNIDAQKPKNKCGDSPMPLAGESPHGGLIPNSIQPHANLNRFKEKITRSTRDPVPTRQEKNPATDDKARTGQANARTTPEAIRTGEANGSNTSERVAITKPDRT